MPSHLPTAVLILVGLASGPCLSGLPVVVTDPRDPRLGAIASLRDARGVVNPPGGHYFSTRAQGMAPDRILATFRDRDTFEIRLGYSKLPCFQAQRIATRPDGIRFDLRFWCAEPTSFPKGLFLESWSGNDQPRMRNHLGTWRGLDTMGAFPVAQLASEIELAGAEGRKVRLWTPNPTHAFWRSGWDRRQVLLEILPVWTANPGGGDSLGSTLAPGDTLSRSIVVRSQPEGAVAELPLLGISMHRGGAFRSAMMFFDELPNREHWLPVSLSRSTPGSEIAKLLVAHPQARLGWVAMTDRISSRELPSFPPWEHISPWVTSDSLEPQEGKWSALLFPPLRDSAFLTQTFPVPKGVSSGNFSLRLRNLSRQPKDLRLLVHGVRGPVLGRFSLGTSAQWKQVSLTVPLLAGDSNRITLVLQGQDSMLLLDDVRLVAKDGVPLLRNGGFEAGERTYVASRSRRAWSDFHGMERMTQAPASYRDWFRDLVEGKGREGWESRTYVGCHGYHHDPSFREPNPAHEFQVDSLQTRWIFENIHADARALGVHPAMTRFWRTPGFKYHSWTIAHILDSGASFLDVGLQSASRGSGGVRYVQRKGNRLWGLPLNWWSDIEDGSFRFPTASVHRVLDQGGVVQAGGHPEETILVPGDARRLDTLLHRMEAVPGFAWTTPVEWSRHADSLLALEVVEATSSQSLARIVLRGRIPAGASVFWHPGDLGSDEVHVRLADGDALVAKVLGGTAMAVLPARDGATTTEIVFQRGGSVGARREPGPGDPSERPLGLSGKVFGGAGVVLERAPDGSWRKRIRLR